MSTFHSVAIKKCYENHFNIIFHFTFHHFPANIFYSVNVVCFLHLLNIIKMPSRLNSPGVTGLGI